MAKSKTKQETPQKASLSKPPPLMFKALTHAQIAQRAFELYMERTPSEGTPDGDWIKAELELREKLFEAN